MESSTRVSRATIPLNVTSCVIITRIVLAKMTSDIVTCNNQVEKIVHAQAQLRLKFILVINVKMPIIVGILAFLVG